MKKINIIGASTLAALEGNLVMTLLPNVLRRAVRWGSSAVGIACLMITTAAGAGETWDTFASGAGVNGPVRAVTTFDGDLIVGGQFGTAGGVPGTFVIAGWDGTGWSALGSGTLNTVLASRPSMDELYRGRTVHDRRAACRERATSRSGTGSRGRPLGTGMNGAVYSLTTFNGALYAGGAFTKAGGTTVNYIAKWNGSAWSSVGSGMNGNVRALTTFNGELYRGRRVHEGGQQIGSNRIAKWNGSAWSKLGTGMSATVSSPLRPSTAVSSRAGSSRTAGGVRERAASRAGTDRRGQPLVAG